MVQTAIIGGGIGGLSTAIALGRYGFESNVFEQAPALLDVGAAIAIWPNAMRALQHLEIADKVLSEAGVIDEIHWLTHEGKRLNAVRIPNDDTPAVALHRADLQRVLLQALPFSSINLGHAISHCKNADTSTAAYFSNGEATTCQFLIGADGVHSVVRTELFGNDPIRPRGYTVWRGISAGTPEGIPRKTALELQGRGKRFGIGPVGRERIGWWAAANSSITNHSPEESPSDAHEELIELFESWFPPVLELIKSTPTILRTGASDRSARTTWGRGRMTLLGDAIHPTTPNLGQGGCMAIEDAVMLARCFEKYGPSEAALRAYERARYGRTAAITFASRVYGQLGQWETKIAAGVRSNVISALPRALIEQFMKIIFDYDVARVRI